MPAPPLALSPSLSAPLPWPARHGAGWTTGHLTLWRILLAVLLPFAGAVMLQRAFGIPEALLAPLLPNVVAAGSTTALGQLGLLAAMLAASLMLPFRRAAVVGGAFWLYLLACLMDLTPVPLLLALPLFLALLAVVLTPLLASRPVTGPDPDLRTLAILGLLRLGIQGVVRVGVVIVALIVVTQSAAGVSLAVLLAEGPHGHALGRRLALQFPLALTVVSWAAALAGLAAALGVPPLRAAHRAWLVLFVLLLLPAVILKVGPAGLAPAIVWLLAADPRWVSPRPREAPPATVFYDGTCAFCHGLVRLALAEEPAATLTFAPLGGTTWQRQVGAAARTPNSVVLLLEDGTRLQRSAAVRAILLRLGGGWRILGTLLGMVPAPVADAGYGLVAGLRRLLVPGRPATACPAVAPHLRSRIAP